VEIKNAMDIFNDEIEIEDYIRKGLSPEFKSSFNVSIMRDQRVSSYMENEDTSYYKPQELEDIKEEVENFIFYRTEKLNLKELKFIRDIGMTRDVASQLDFNGRKKLETTFHELREYNILCFKAKANSTARRALVFPLENQYSKFFETMKKFLNKYDSVYIPMLKSRVKVKFRGKYVLQIEDDTFRNFIEKIKETINHYKLTYKVKLLVKRRLIEIESNHEKVKDMRDCMKDIMTFLFPKPCDDYIDRLNNKFSGKAYGRFDHKSKRFLLRSDPKVREHYLQMMESWVGTFNNKVKKFEYRLNNRKAYFTHRAKAKDIASRYDAQIKYNHQSKSLLVYYHEHIKEEDRTLPSTMAQMKAKDMENLRVQFDSIFFIAGLDDDMANNSGVKSMKDTKDSRGS
jgi:uncharacterized protein with von Willebrand factor type A (vWA) domain